MSTWNNLMTELQRLNQEARNIQKFDEEGTPLVEVPNPDIEKFVSDYLAFYSDCLALLPEDLKDLFRAAYEKSIKDFLINPTEIESFHSMEYNYTEYFFKYPYSEHFYKPFLHKGKYFLKQARESQRQ